MSRIVFAVAFAVVLAAALLLRDAGTAEAGIHWCPRFP